MVDIEKLAQEVEQELTNITYTPDDVETNVRIIEDARRAISDFGIGIVPTAKHIAEVATAARENLQMRDFFMGVRSEKDIAPHVFDYLFFVTGALEKKVGVPLATVFTSYIYEQGEFELAKSCIKEILEVEPDYSLADLLAQVFNGGWPVEALAVMAQQLHESVLNNIYNTNEETDDNNN